MRTSNMLVESFHHRDTNTVLVIGDNCSKANDTMVISSEAGQVIRVPFRLGVRGSTPRLGIRHVITRRPCTTYLCAADTPGYQEKAGITDSTSCCFATFPYFTKPFSQPPAQQETNITKAA